VAIELSDVFVVSSADRAGRGEGVLCGITASVRHRAPIAGIFCSSAHKLQSDISGKMAAKKK
jgi:hypothetical protein